MKLPAILRAACLLIGILTIAADAARSDLLFGKYGSPGPYGNDVLRYREDGTFLGVAGYAGETNQGIALGPNGNLYVVSNNVGLGWIEQFNPVTGASLGLFVNGDIFPYGPYQVPNGITFGADGNCYSTSMAIEEGGVTGVVRFDGTSGAFLGVVIAPDTNGLGTPNDVLKMPGGDLLVSDGSRINRYDGASLAFEGIFVAPGSGGIGSITQYTFGPDGDFYVSSMLQNAVLRYDGDTGAFMDTFISSVTRPAGLTFGNDGQLYVVADAFAMGTNVQRFDGTTGAALGTFLGPNPIYQVGYYLITAPDVPEPAVGLVAALGVGALGFARRRQSFVWRDNRIIRHDSQRVADVEMGRRRFVKGAQPYDG